MKIDVHSMVTEATQTATLRLSIGGTILCQIHTRKSLAALSSLTSGNNYLERKYQLGADPLAIYEVNPRS